MLATGWTFCAVGTGGLPGAPPPGFDPTGGFAGMAGFGFGAGAGALWPTIEFGRELPSVGEAVAAFFACHEGAADPLLTPLGMAGASAAAAAGAAGGARRGPAEGGGGGGAWCSTNFRLRVSAWRMEDGSLI